MKNVRKIYWNMILLQEGESFDSLLDNNQLFKDFNLVLDESSRYNKKKLSELEEMKLKFRLRRYVRAIMIRQNKPDDNSRKNTK